jgi:hypothetical protein
VKTQGMDSSISSPSSDRQDHRWQTESAENTEHRGKEDF